MVRDQILSRLRAHEAELRAAGIVRLALFGSVARDEARPDSDIDLLVTFDDGRELSLLDVIGVENRLADLLGQRVDLVEDDMLEPRLRQSVEREIVRAF
jgi:predicted nucleotidyltransferase